MIRAFQWDLARQVERLDVLLRLLPRYAAWGYQELYLHLEDAVHYPSLPGIGRADAYRYEELGELVLAAARVGIRVVPIVNLLGHTQYLIKHPDWRELNELRDEHGHPLVGGQICPLHPRTLEVAARLLDDMAPYCTAGKVHVGLDESFHLGKCPRCRAEVERIGLAGHFAGHVTRLHQLISARGLQLGLWADMLYFIPQAIPQLPRGIVAYDWYYYPFQRQPRVEFYNFAERDLFPALFRQGIQYYGCPMNGAFRHEPLPVFGDRLANIRAWWQRCTALKAEGMLVTSWEAYRLALETTTLVDAAAANLWLEPSHDDATAMLTSGLARTFGPTTWARQARALLAADSHAFAGYARWQINERWDVFAGRDSVKPYVAELRFFERLQDPSYGWPPPLAASIDFRRYLAQRDVFVRTAAHAVLRCRRLLRRDGEAAVRELLRTMEQEARDFGRAIKTGARAARLMWRRTRTPAENSQNDLQLAADARRLADWQRWLRQARRQPALVTGANPMAGAWQLQFVVHNLVPAVARVIVEERGPDGAWREIASRYTIEFRASAARQTARIRREFTAPVIACESPLRIRVAGVGQAGISQVVLTDGVMTRSDPRFRRIRLLGRKAPTRGLPDPKQQGASCLLDFSGQ
jgi:hypothetical protein